MVYEQQFVAVVEQGGRVLREHDGAVRLPFGSDYGLRLKNLNSRRAVVAVSVDGENVLGGNRIVVEPNGETRLDGFMDPSGRVRRKFRFVQKTQEVVEHRGDRLDDGLVRVEFWYERPEPETRIVQTIYREKAYPWYDPWPYRTYPYRPWPYDGITWCNSPNTTRTFSGGAMNTSVTLTAFHSPKSAEPLADEGITVKGGMTEQDFRTVPVAELETAAHVIVIRLRGTTEAGQPISRAVTTRQRLACPTCGRHSKSSAKYCSGCGSALEECAVGAEAE